jgi:protoheme ferro-lyase
MSTALLWGLLVGGALACGAAIATTLAVAKRAEPLALLLFLAGMGLSTFALIEIGEVEGSGQEVLWAVAFMIAAVGGGYALVSSLLLEPAKRDRRISTTIPLDQSAMSPTPAVVVLGCVESERFSMIETASLLADLAEEGRLEASVASLPLLFFAQKVRYNAVGGRSPAREQIASVARRLEASLCEHRRIRVTWASCAGADRLAEKVSSLASAGHTEIAIVEPYVATSSRATAARREVDALRLGDQGVSIVHSGPMGASERLALMIAERIAEVTDDPGLTGVALVGHGQPEEVAHHNPEYDRDETTFLNRVRMSLIEQGFAPDRLRIAWAEWAEPTVTSTVRHLAALGCSRIVVSPAVHPFDGLQTMLDLDIAIRQARVDVETSVVLLSAWGDDPALMTEIELSVTAALGG